MQSNASNYMSAPARKTSRRVRDPARFASDNHAAPRFAPVAAVQGIEYDPTSDRAPRIDDEDVWAGLIISSFFRPVDGVESDDDMHPRTPNERQEYISDGQRMLSSVLPPEPEGPLVHKPPEWSKQTYGSQGAREAKAFGRTFASLASHPLHEAARGSSLASRLRQFHVDRWMGGRLDRFLGSFQRRHSQRIRLRRRQRVSSSVL